VRKLPIVESRSAVHEVLPPVPAAFPRDAFPALTDDRGRAYTYLRLGVTDRCDLACVYCMPPGGEDDHALRRDLLSFEEAARLVDVMARMGIRRVRFTVGSRSSDATSSIWSRSSGRRPGSRSSRSRRTPRASPSSHVRFATPASRA
jgi:hypothetical protein